MGIITLGLKQIGLSVNSDLSIQKVRNITIVTMIRNESLIRIVKKASLPLTLYEPHHEKT